MTEPAADFRLDSFLLGQMTTMSVAGVVAVALTVATVDSPWIYLASALAGGVAGFGVGWWVTRRGNRRLFEGLSAAVGPVHRSGAVGVRLGALQGLLAVTAAALVLVGEGFLSNDSDPYRLVGPLLLVFASLPLSTRRRLRRWQQQHGLLVCTRAGVRRFAWTRSQARTGLVVVGTAETAR